ncbi:M14 family metallopeptidase [Bacillus paranthracis]|uniref:M14 family metallopeptidase n=1 Tax=Bacillus paranthracis TaxID=2026186 RepID=UPI0021D38C50|nr:M14 family metallopeptidase [Bacillus paranthracis]MCU5209331.1 M14 family metallopeptidase [Bacillus paranthracis]
MTISLNRLENTAQDRYFRNKMNENWDKLEGTHNIIEQQSKQAIVDSDTAKKEAQEANKLSNNVKKQLETLVVSGDSGPEAVQARVDKDGVVHDTLKERIDSESSKIETLDNISGSVVSSFWKPPAQPPARTDIPGYFADGFAWNAEQYIAKLWEPLREVAPDYITRINLGKDTSNTYDFWKYEFTPINYEKTLVIGSLLHGGETTAMLALYRFLYHVVHDWKKYPQLAYIRNKVKLVVLPIQNPYGVSQLPRTRQNSNGVDVNRNFDINWYSYPTGSPWDHDYKGFAPFSEKESQYIKLTLLQHSDSLAYLDLHNLGSPDADFVFYLPKKAEVRREIFRDVMEAVKPGTKSVVWGESTNPSGYVYAGEVLKMHGSNPEFPDKRFGSQMYDSTEMTKAVEWYGNIILQHAKLESKAGVKEFADPFSVRSNFSYAGTGNAITFPIGNYAELLDLRISFPVPAKGVILVKGEITFRGTDEASQNFISPYTGQIGSVDFLPARRDLLQEVYGEGMQRQTLPFSAEFPVCTTSQGGYGDAVVGVHARATAGTVTVFRYHCTATFIPTNKKDAYRVFDATGRAGQGTSSMIQTY